MLSCACAGMWSAICLSSCIAYADHIEDNIFLGSVISFYIPLLTLCQTVVIGMERILLLLVSGIPSLAMQKNRHGQVTFNYLEALKKENISM